MGVVRRRSNLVQIAVFSLAWGLCVLFLALPFTAFAAGVTYQTTRVGPASYVTNGFTVPITVNVAPSGGVPRYQQIKPFVSPSTLGRLGRSAIRGGGVGLAVAGIIEGLGYLIDQATGEIKKTSLVYPEPDYGEFINGPGSSGGTCDPASLPFQFVASTANPSRPTWCSGEPQYNYKAWDCPDPAFPIGYDGIGYSDPRAFRCYASAPSSPDPIETYIDLDPSDFSRIDSALSSQLSLFQKGSLIASAISNASPRGSLDSSGYPVNPLTSSNSSIQSLFSDFPELRIALQNMLNAELAALIAASNPEFSPSPDEQVIVDNGSDLPPMEPPSDFVMLGFCEWASFLCEPFVGEAHPPIPRLDIETPTFDSGLPSSATCPAPYPLVTSFGTWEITFQFACDMASAIRTPLIAIAYLMSAFIVVGVRK